MQMILIGHIPNQIKMFDFLKQLRNKKKTMDLLNDLGIDPDPLKGGKKIGNLFFETSGLGEFSAGFIISQ